MKCLAELLRRGWIAGSSPAMTPASAAPTAVMPGLDPGIHPLAKRPFSSPRMRGEMREQQRGDLVGHLVGGEMADARQDLEPIGRGARIRPCPRPPRARPCRRCRPRCRASARESFRAGAADVPRARYQASAAAIAASLPMHREVLLGRLDRHAVGLVAVAQPAHVVGQQARDRVGFEERTCDAPSGAPGRRPASPARG